MALKLFECLQGEKNILDLCAVIQHSPSPTEQTQTDLDLKVIELQNQTEKIEEEIKALEKVESIYTTWESEVQQMNGLANSQIQEKCRNQANCIKTKKMEVISLISGLLELAAVIVKLLVSEELPEWKCKQQMSCIGKPVNTSLELLEKWFSCVAESLLQILQQLKKLQISPVSDLPEVIQQISSFTTSLLKTLMENALVVEKQPVMYNQPHRPLVVRTNVLFSVKLRFLVNLQNLQYGCWIKAEFDKDVEEIKTIPGYRQFQFTAKDTKVMEQNEGLVADWDLSVKENKAKRKRSNESPILVTEELHMITFSADLKFACLDCQVKTNTLPLTIVSTTSQIPSAWASVLWYNLYCPAPLTKEEGLWFWIDGILDLIENHLKKLWRDGRIMGFVNKKKACDLLQNKQSGNFLLRFSESNKEGAITFSWVHKTKKVHAIDPFTKDELKQKSLADNIKTFRAKNGTDNPLLYLYPDIPKDNAFGRYYSNMNEVPINQPVTPYVKKTYVCEADCPSPRSSSPPQILMDMDQDWRDIRTPSPMLSPGTSEQLNDLMSDVLIYTEHNNNEEGRY
ncbi:hypothetical protein WMY93_002142 [Mugilogobius chulae]|uniref:SH2 domain-containing protein n=1 Tax=Mugilogobius chulae TaxID=88201 RepID=A0AAW0PSY6_9GOBI